MPRREYDMKTIFDIPLWENICDKLAELTGTAIISIDFKGTPVTKHSARTEFCSIIRENPVSRKRCFRCDALAGLEAVRLERPYIYLCHCGIVDVAVPVLVGDHYLGAVMFGQVRIPEGDTDAKVERLVNEISSFEPDGENSKQDLMELYEKLPVMEYERIVQTAALLDEIVKYIVDRAVKSRHDMDAYRWLTNLNAGFSEKEPEIYELISPLGKSDDAPERLPVSKSSNIYAAVEHIHNHPKDNVSLKQMADLCHLSPTYFSKIFSRDVGESFVSYVSRRKIELSKRMLRETDKSVTQIALELGYHDTSHFISMFKRYEGITPTGYRQYSCK